MEERGFSFVELLVVVGIVGILSAIAVPQFSEFRKNAYNAAASSDLRNAATAEEAYYALNEEYLSCQNESCIRSADGTSGLPGVKAISSTVNIKMVADNENFTGEASSSKVSKIFFWNSENGGMQEPRNVPVQE